MPPSAPRATSSALGSYKARLAQRVLCGGRNAEPAAMALLEHCQPETLDAAVALLASQGELTPQAFDRLADAWRTFRHISHLGWE